MVALPAKKGYISSQGLQALERVVGLRNRRSCHEHNFKGSVAT